MVFFIDESKNIQNHDPTLQRLKLACGYGHSLCGTLQKLVEVGL